MSRVGFILKPDKSEAGALLETLVPWLRAEGHVPIVTAEDQVMPAGVEVVAEDSLAEASEITVVLGGDGTMLRAARLVADRGRPVLGVNLGKLGFLTGFAPEEARSALGAALRGTLPISERMRLSVKLQRSGVEPVTRAALNDVVIHQGAMARLVELDAHVDGQFVAAYRADGLIIATPTGSTAYNMAAGGPILIPGQAAMALTPICAHSLTNRPLVVPAQSMIRIRLGADTRGVVLTVDGQWGHPFLPGDVAELTEAPTPLRVFMSTKSYFDVMREKLNWGLRSDRNAR